MGTGVNLAEKGASNTPFHQKGTIRAPIDRPLVGTGSLRAVHWRAQHGGLVGGMPTTFYLKICPDVTSDTQVVILWYLQIKPSLNEIIY